MRNCCYVNSILRALFSLEDFCFDLETSLVGRNVKVPLPILFDLFVKLMRVSDDDDEEELVEDLHR
jgi:hypothetical protein